MFFFTSDTHFHHTNIIKYCNRPFFTVDEMDAVLISNWNSVVSPKDIVYHLGDFVLGTDLSIIEKLNGRKHLLCNRDHHDREFIRALEHFEPGFESFSFSLVDPLKTISINNQHVVMCHFPLARWNLMHYGSWHLYGHCHGRYSPKSGFLVDVGIDNAYKLLGSYRPFSFDEIKQIMSERKEDKGLDS